MSKYKNTKQKYNYLVFLERKHVVQPALSLKIVNTNQAALYLSRSKAKNSLVPKWTLPQTVTPSYKQVWSYDLTETSWSITNFKHGHPSALTCLITS